MAGRVSKSVASSTGLTQRRGGTDRFRRCRARRIRELTRAGVELQARAGKNHSRQDCRPPSAVRCLGRLTQEQIAGSSGAVRRQGIARTQASSAASASDSLAEVSGTPSSRLATTTSRAWNGRRCNSAGTRTAFADASSVQGQGRNRSRSTSPQTDPHNLEMFLRYAGTMRRRQCPWQAVDVRRGTCARGTQTQQGVLF